VVGSGCGGVVVGWGNLLGCGVKFHCLVVCVCVCVCVYVCVGVVRLLRCGVLGSVVLCCVAL